MKSSASQLECFARDVLHRPLYPYQLEVATAILDSIRGGHGRIFTVMMARQSGKNQISAILEAYLLLSREQGTIIKAAPTFTPQIINSRLRLLSMLDLPFMRARLWTSNGYIIGLAARADPLLLRARSGPRIMFYSAGPESNVVGATADILLEIDEAQDVELTRFDRDFRPMASTSNATTVLYGTASSDHTLLARQRAINLEHERLTGERRHFEYNWETLAAINPAYRAFVEQEIARLGEDHPAIQTQYWLRPVDGAGYLLNTLQHALLQGSHAWEEVPAESSRYIAGLDVAGEERLSGGATGQESSPGTLKAARKRRDSSVLTIGKVCFNELHLPRIEVVQQLWWTGMGYLDQYAAILTLVEKWGIRTLVVDATGLGAGLASMLSVRLGTARVIPYTFTRPSKSHLTYQLLSFINSGRLKLYAPSAETPLEVFSECQAQLRAARYRLGPADTLDMYVDPADGHDDFLMSLALLLEGLESYASSPASSLLIHPERLYKGEGRF